MRKTLFVSVCTMCSMLSATSGYAQTEDGSYTINFSPDGWATFSALTAYTIPEGVEVYAGLIQQYSDDQNVDGANYYLELHPISFENKRYIPQPVPNSFDGSVSPLNPIILHSTAGQPITIKEIEDYDPANLYADFEQETSIGMLCGTGDKDEVIGNYGSEHYYVLGYKPSLGTAFYEVASGTIVPANRAYISIYDDIVFNAAPRLSIVVTDEELHIGSCIVDSDSRESAATYTLQGMKATELHEGNIYIRGDRKFVYHSH